jgi:sarcosine oxidase
LIHKGVGDDELFYSLPAINGRGIKIAQHGGAACDADTVNRHISASDFQPVQKFIQRYVKAWADSPIAESATCIYTMTPDEHFRLGPVSQNPRVILASPCSGHGFKFGPLIGKILAELSTQGNCDLLPEVWNPLSTPQAYRSSL